MISAERCFLETVEWRTIPWANDLNQKTRLSYVLDVSCIIPGFFKDFISIHSTPIPGSSRPIVYQIPNVCTIYRYFTSKFKTNFPRCRCGNRAGTPPILLPRTEFLKKYSEKNFPNNDFPITLFGPPLHFPHPLCANEFCCYNAKLILLLNLAQLLPIPSSPKISTSAIPSVTIRSARTLTAIASLQHLSVPRASRTPRIFSPTHALADPSLSHHPRSRPR